MAEVASAYVSLLPSARGFGRATESQISGEMKSSGSRLGGILGAGLKVGLLAGAGAIFGGGAFLKGAIEQASDLNEQTTKTAAIFGDAAKQVNAFSDGGAKALGQTKLAVLDAASTFGVFGKSAGLSGDDLADFSTDFVSLSTDLASFNNTSPEQAVDAIGAALRGESEPLRQFGVLLDDATLRQEALKLGLIETTKDALTPQNKVLAAQSAIYKQTEDAQGDFQKTSGGLANQQRILSASFSDIKTQIGTALLPVATRFFTFLNDKGIPAISTAASFLTTNLGPAFSMIGDTISSVFGSGSGGGGAISAIVGFGMAIGTALIPVVQELYTAFTTQILPALKSLAESVRANFLPVLQTMGNSFTGTILPALTSFHSYLVANVVPIFVRVVGVIRDEVVPILASLATFVVSTLVPAVVKIAQAVGARLKPVFDQLVATFRSSVQPTLQLLLAKFKEYQPTIQKVISVAVQVTGKMLQFSAAVLGKVLPPVIRFAGFLLRNLVPAIVNTIEFVAKIIGKVIEFGKAVVDRVQDIARFVTGLKQKFGEAVAFTKTIPGKILSALGDIGQELYNYAVAAAGRLISGLVDGIRAQAGRVKDAVSSVVGGIKGLLPGSPIKEGPLKNWNNGGAGKRLMDMLALGINDGAAVVAKAAGGAADGISKKVQEKFEGLRETTASMVSSLKSEFQSLRDSIASTFSSDLFSATSAGSFVSDLLGKRSSLRGLTRAFRTLQGYGIDPAFLTQLFQSGNGSLILDLASGSRKSAREAASLFGQVDSLANNLGVAVAKNDPNYGELIKQTQELKDIKDELKKMPKRLGREINGAASNGHGRRVAA